jgi:S-formylglutathione hydrolase FrmB
MRSSLIGFLVLLHSLSSLAGELETKTLSSEALGMEMKVNVLLPDSYQSEKDRRYPAVYLLHGYGGDYTEWTKVGVAAEAKGLDVIIAMPEGDKSFYVNHSGEAKGRWEDYLTKEVVQFVDRNYRTASGREARAISGLSMGGYGAMVLGLRHPELFGAIVSHSGALQVPGETMGGEIGDRLTKIFGPPESPERKSYDLRKLITELPAEKRPDIYIDCGSSDFLLEANRAFVAELAKLHVPYEYREVPGAHNYEYWKRNVRYSLTHQIHALGEVKVASSRPAASAVAAAAPAAPAEKGPEKPAPGGQAGILGDWQLSVDFQGQPREYLLRLLEKEKRLEAVLISPRSGEHAAKAVSFKDGALHFEIDREYAGMAVTLLYEGKLTAQGLSGMVRAEGLDEFKAAWSAKRKKAKGEEL